ncbi:MAG: PP0621 family protein [Acidiferrobacter sp.]
MKLLVDLLVAWALWLLVRRLFRSQPPLRSTSRPTPVRRRVRAAGDMVACAHCGLYVPRAESVSGGPEATFCCLEHKEAAARR